MPCAWVSRLDLDCLLVDLLILERSVLNKMLDGELKYTFEQAKSFH